MPKTPIKAVNILGKTFGRLTVLDVTNERYQGNVILICKCICGNQTKTITSALLNGNTTSCGCARKGTNLRHGQSGSHGTKRPTKTYMSWTNMLSRCYNTRNRYYYNYGGRGITVNESWKDFTNFYKDMGDQPLGYTLERLDNNKSYNRENCKWATKSEQANNKRNTIRLTWKGETKTIRQWSTELDINFNTLWGRLKVGWSVERVLSTPTDIRYRKNN